MFKLHFSPTRTIVRCWSWAFLVLTLLGRPAGAHNLTGDPANPHYDWSVQPPLTVTPGWFLAQTGPAGNPAPGVLPTPPVRAGQVPPQSEVFAVFAPRVMVRWDNQYLYIEDNGLPAHGMMTGITAWQQQVPLPQPYTGDNAWRLPLNPVPAQHPVSIRGRFLRGAIAIAANGIPIFNPQNNRGEISADIGELDQWGGHCGRGDDYHYHAAPLHLQSLVGPGRPIAFALDGYAIYGLAEPDGSPVTGLDAFHGHATPGVGYHYHASTKYPFVNGGFHGEVVERNGQVDPQPRARSVRPATFPLPGATITDLTVSPDQQTFALRYSVNGQPASVNYATTGNGIWRFQYHNADGTTVTKTYQARDGSGPPPGEPPRRRRAEANSTPDDRRPPDGPNGPPPDNAGRPPRDEARPARRAAIPEFTPPRSGHLVLHSSAVTNGGALPVEFTGDGAAATLPLDWSGEPAGTKSFAVIMHHIPGPGDVKWYWTLYNIPASVHSLPKNVRGIGTLGNNSVNDEAGYAPPHSKGPGPKIYRLTVYALSAPVTINRPAEEVSRAVLLAAMRTNILDSAELRVVYDRTAAIRRQGGEDGPPADESNR